MNGHPRGATVRMSDAEWSRAEDLARRARTSRTKVLRVALARLDATPDEIGEEAWNLNDGRFEGGSPAAPVTDEERHARKRLARRVGCSQGQLMRIAFARLADVPLEELRAEAEALPDGRGQNLHTARSGSDVTESGIAVVEGR
jgi:hypothetical protein